MDQALRTSWPTRLAAVGFIIVILAGNGWLAYALLDRDVPELIAAAFALGIGMSLLGGLGMSILIVKRRLTAAAGPTEAGED